MATFDFSRVPKPKTRNTDPEWSNPVSFFYKLAHPKIRDLYPIQRDILQTWFSAFRDCQNDKMVMLNTGGGKTLIGIMMAEAIRRQGGGKVLYLCPNNFLGKQTVDESKKYGIRVARYLKLGLEERTTWENKDAFLDDGAVCVTNYDAVFNARSIFKEYEIKGVIFDDAHLSPELLDKQFSLRVEDPETIKAITDIFKSSPTIKEKIKSIQSGDPVALTMIPPLEWHQQVDAIKNILEANEAISTGLSWLNLKEKLDKTFCFVSAKKLDISFLYPDIRSCYVLQKDIHRVFLSATLPNLDDLTRVFGITPSKIETNNPDYRPQRLFISSSKLKFADKENQIRKDLSKLSSKVLILVPSKADTMPYEALGSGVVSHSSEAEEKIEAFKEAESGMLTLANRYDGIDLPGGICHCLVIDGLPYTGALKTKFFSEFFHNHKNSFLRSIVASKLVQAFGRTIRANNDYSIILLLGDKLNSWVINRDNRKFFKPDIAEDIEIGIDISESVQDIETLKALAGEFLNQTEGWKNFIDERKGATARPTSVSKTDEQQEVALAQKERKIHDLFLLGDYEHCLQNITEAEKDLVAYSKTILGLYLSIASICCKETGDARLNEFSSRAYGINPIFGMPATSNSKNRSLQAQRIIDFENLPSEFDWTHRNKNFDENLKKIGEALGFESYRPETISDGTLDVCWYDEEKMVVLGFENKVNKENKTLTKHEVDQCSGHMNWLTQKYPDYKKILFVVGDIENYHGLASPGNLNVLSKNDIQAISDNVMQIHAKKTHPDQIDPSLDSGNLRIDKIFSENSVSSLPRVSFN